MGYATGYSQLALTFFRNPRAFPRTLDVPALQDVGAATVYLIFGLTLTTAFLLINLNLIPANLAEPLRQSLKRDGSLFSYFVSVGVFALVAHGVFRLLSGSGALSSTISALFRLFSILFPLTTFLLVVSSRIFSPVLETFLFVIPPLGVRVTDPFPLLNALPLAAGFMTIHLFVALFFLASAVWTLREIHKMSAVRSWIGVGSALAATAALSAPIALLSSVIYKVLGPLVDIFLK